MANFTLARHTYYKSIELASRPSPLFALQYHVLVTQAQRRIWFDNYYYSHSSLTTLLPSLAKLTAEVIVGKRCSELNLLKKPCLDKALQSGVGGAANNTWIPTLSCSLTIYEKESAHL